MKRASTLPLPVTCVGVILASLTLLSNAQARTPEAELRLFVRCRSHQEVAVQLIGFCLVDDAVEKELQLTRQEQVDLEFLYLKFTNHWTTPANSSGFTQSIASCQTPQAGLSKILGKQREGRVRQLYWQWFLAKERPSALIDAILGDPILFEKLQVSSDQCRRRIELQELFRKQLNKLYLGALDLKGETLHDRLRTISRRHEKEVCALFTDIQFRQFKMMVGTPGQYPSDIVGEQGLENALEKRFAPPALPLDE